MLFSKKKFRTFFENTKINTVGLFIEKKKKASFIRQKKNIVKEGN